MISDPYKHMSAHSKYVLYHDQCSDPYVNTAHSSIGWPIHEWDAKDVESINCANGRPIHQWAQPIYQSNDKYLNIIILDIWNYGKNQKNIRYK